MHEHDFQEEGDDDDHKDDGDDDDYCRDKGVARVAETNLKALQASKPRISQSCSHSIRFEEASKRATLDEACGQRLLVVSYGWDTLC